MMLLLKVEHFTRRNNFRVVGIPVSEKEDCEDLVKEKLFSLFEDTSDLSIERCHIGTVEVPA